MNIHTIINDINNFVWGPIMLTLLMGTGLFLTIRLRFLPWRNLIYAIKLVAKRRKNNLDGDISPFQSLMTALAATIGTGNIVGVSTALVLGGPGAIIWMWISALFGLSTKYAESLLAVKYRETNSVGEMSGGPMYSMKNGIRNKYLGRTLAFLFAFFATFASFGAGNMTQANAISEALNTTFGVDAWFTGILLVILCAAVLLKGIKKIGQVCSYIIPFMAAFYFISSIGVIIVNFENVPQGLHEMFRMAFSVEAVSGGIGGTIIANMLSAMRWGVARGVFSNEAGLGTAPIAAAAAQTDSAPRQGYINMTGTFFDTMIICFLTGLLLASSGVLGSTEPTTGKLVSGATLTIKAFATAYGTYGSLLVTITLCLFAYSTILGWEYYGEKSLEYLIKNRTVIMSYRVLFCLITFVGATTTLDLVWNFSDAMNGLMAIPNLISLLILHREIAKETFTYQIEVINK